MTDALRSLPSIGDTVRLLDYPADGINSHARIDVVTTTGVLVSNMNMPWQGTLAHQPIATGRFVIERRRLT